MFSGYIREKAIIVVFARKNDLCVKVGKMMFTGNIMEKAMVVDEVAKAVQEVTMTIVPVAGACADPGPFEKTAKIIGYARDPVKSTIDQPEVCFTCAKPIWAPVGVPCKPGMTRADLSNNIARIARSAKGIVESAAKYCPFDLIVIPVNTIVHKTLDAKNCKDQLEECFTCAKHILVPVGVPHKLCMTCADPFSINARSAEGTVESADKNERSFAGHCQAIPLSRSVKSSDCHLANPGLTGFPMPRSEV